MLRAELGWTTAKPPETVTLCVSQIFPPPPRGSVSGRTEETLAAALLNDLDDTGLQLLNRRDVVGEDTHLTGLGGDVDLDGILGLVDGLDECGNKQSARGNVALVGSWSASFVIAGAATASSSRH